jgi:archaellum component FlaC
MSLRPERKPSLRQFVLKNVIEKKLNEFEENHDEIVRQHCGYEVEVLNKMIETLKHNKRVRVNDIKTLKIRNKRLKRNEHTYDQKLGICERRIEELMSTVALLMAEITRLENKHGEHKHLGPTTRELKEELDLIKSDLDSLTDKSDSD